MLKYLSSQSISTESKNLWQDHRQRWAHWLMSHDRSKAHCIAYNTPKLRQWSCMPLKCITSLMRLESMYIIIIAPVLVRSQKTSWSIFRTFCWLATSGPFSIIHVLKRFLCWEWVVLKMGCAQIVWQHSVSVVPRSRSNRIMQYYSVKYKSKVFYWSKSVFKITPTMSTLSNYNCGAICLYSLVVYVT